MESPLAPSQETVEFAPSVRLPHSAQAFTLWNEKEQRAQEVPPFGPDKFVIYGRDADYLAMAIAASEFGKPPVIGKPIRLSISSKMGYGAKEEPAREMIRKLFEQKGITKDFIHIDIGKYGNVPRNILRSLWPELTEDEVNARVKLVDPYHLKRIIDGIERTDMLDKEKKAAIKEVKANPGFRPIESLGEVSELDDKLLNRHYATIESRPHAKEMAGGFIEHPVTGKISIPQRPADSESALLSWVVAQAVVREFLPRPPKRPFWENWGRKSSDCTGLGLGIQSQQ